MDDKRLYETEVNAEGYSLCSRIREQIPDLLEGCLDVMTSQAIRAHLSVCYFCAKIYGDMERTITLVETMPVVDPMKDFGPAIMAKIQSQRASPLKRVWMKLRPNRE
jgi:hypothetical protein